MNKIIQYEPKLLKKLEKDYDLVHNTVHESEDRLEIYKSFYEEMNEFLQEHSLDKEVREKTEKILGEMEKLIEIEEGNTRKDSARKSNLLSKYNRMKKNE